MATELGKAYVQIIPSAKGISGSISNLMKGESQSAGTTAGGLLGGNLVKSLKTVLAAAGIGKAISATLMEGANLEQSLGGIETLFKDDADKVKQYARDAYATAGLSANDYMENVTSFSASLLQSLGGDTSAAAEVANMALIDMSDNANKMGSSMESIQDAYQGFAKQNYTMLDNLKLGYGGTKTEMERLLADATALSGVEYNIENLSDVYEAIHVIQDELDITGTTAIEAAETFSGSMASMKAALSNVMGQMALGEDIKPALNALAETTSTFLFDNFFPMIGNILSALPGAIVTFISAAIPHVIKTGKNLMNYLGEVILSVIPDTFKPLTKQFTKLGKSAEKGLSSLVDGVQDVWATLSDFVSEIDWGTILTNLQTVLNSALQFFKPWVDGIRGHIDIMIGYFEGLWDAIKQGLSGDWSGAFETLKQTFVTAIIGVAENAISSFMGMWDNLKTLVASIDWVATAQTLMTALGSAISGAMSFIGDIGTAIQEWIFTSLGVTTWGGVGIRIATGIGSAITSALELITTIGTSIRDWIFNALGVSDWTSVGNQIGNLIIAAITALVEFGTTVANTLWGLITSAFGTTSEESGNTVGQTIVDSIIAGITALSEVIAGIATTIWEWISTAWSSIDWASLGAAIVDGIKAGIAAAWETFTSWVSEKAESIKNMFAIPLVVKSPSRVMRDEIGKMIPAGIAVGITDGMPFITSAISGMTNSIANTSIPMPTLNSEVDYNINSAKVATAQLSTQSSATLSDRHTNQPTPDELLDLIKDNMQVVVQGDVELDNNVVGTIMMKRFSQDSGRRTSRALRGLAYE